MPSDLSLPASVQQAGPPDFSQGRQTYTHSSQAEAVALPRVPPPKPISFDDNPDVLALKSAISILQLQRQRAVGDMQVLAQAKAEALEKPDEFVRDLVAGQVRQAPDPLSNLGADLAGGADAMDNDEEGEDDEGGAVDVQRAANAPHAWAQLPGPQDITRCPPVNWSQYAVVGESLDKLHAEQLAAPTPGVPAIIGPGGALDLKTDSRGPEPQRFVGVTAPYVPGRDKLEKKPKGNKR
jgi:hypothetical protein